MRLSQVDIPRFALFLAASDLLWIIVAIYVVASALSGHPGGPLSIRISSGELVIAACMTGCAFMMGLYQRSFLTFSKLLVRTIIALLFSWGLVTIAFSLTPSIQLAASSVFAVHVLAFSGFYLIRIFLVSGVGEINRLKRRVLVVGSADHAHSVRELEFAQRPSQFTCVNAVAWEPSSDTHSTPLAEACRNHHAQEVVVAVREDQFTPNLTAELLACRLAGVQVTSFVLFVERESRRVELTENNTMRLIYSEGSQRNCVSRGIKRAIDIVVSLGILVFTLPVTAAAALALCLSRDGPVFYQQERTGLGGRPFPLLKFRTMRVDAEIDGTPRWAERNDSRVTAIGTFLRRSRIDELPQLINVLRGEMSLVGPRPERPALVADLQKRIPLYKYRDLVPPGITGWAQINYPYGASIEDAVQKTRLDLYYVKNGSILLDLAILLQTVRVVLMAEGSR